MFIRSLKIGEKNKIHFVGDVLFIIYFIKNLPIPNSLNGTTLRP
jgi:hypothetical protein